MLTLSLVDPSCAKSTVPVSVPKLLSTRRFVTAWWGGAGIVACVCEVVKGNVDVDLADALCKSLNSNPGQAVVNDRAVDHSMGHQSGEMHRRVRSQRLRRRMRQSVRSTVNGQASLPGGQKHPPGEGPAGERVPGSDRSPAGCLTSAQSSHTGLDSYGLGVKIPPPAPICPASLMHDGTGFPYSGGTSSPSSVMTPFCQMNPHSPP